MQRIKKIFKILILSFCLAYSACAQSDKKNILKDTLDGKLDASRFLIEANGFIPLPQIITEPSLGYFGLVFAPVFISPNKHAKKGEYVPPNITVGLAGYTANKTWLTGIMRNAHLPQYGLKYKIGAAYSSLNADFYREVPGEGEQKFPFNFKLVPIFGSLIKQIGQSNFYAGLEYLYMYNKITPEFDFTAPPDFMGDESLTSVISSPGILIEYDKRDNVFTPNEGIYFSTDYRVNAGWTGSDFDYESYTFNLLQFYQLHDNWVSGFRAEGKMVFGDAPFFVLPSINMRGVPRSRYQGQQAYVLETEQRYDFTMRWSAVAFTGVAKAIPEGVNFEDARWVYNYGAGFRYLLARMFGLRMGIDLAASNEDFGYYIVFGSSWPK